MGRMVRGLSVAAVFAWSACAAAQDKWGAHIDLEAKPGSKRSLGEADLFLPLMQDARSLWFGSLIARLDDNSNREGNLGLGMRRMLDGGWNLGGYGYFDRRKSGESSEYYNQITLGAEALGRDWDLRGNVYLPQGDRVRELGASGGGAPTASISGASIIVTTPGTNQIEERALRGFDAEVGWRVPLWEAETQRQLRLYAGGYRFEDDVTKVSGPRLRAELTLAELPYLWRGAQFIGSAEVQDDDARGTQAFLSLRLRVPLGGKAERPALNFQERRMTAPVMRDVDIVTQSRTVALTPATAETALAVNGGALTVLDSGTTTGNQLPAAVAAAGPDSTVILTGTFSTNATTFMQSGQTLMGAGTLTVRTPSGRTLTLTTPGGTIAGVVPGGATVEGANSGTLTGLTISNTAQNQSFAVLGNFNNNFSMTNNSIAATGTQGGAFEATAVFIQGGANVTVSGNTMVGTRTTGDGSAFALAVGNGARLIITANTLSASGGTNNRHTFLSSQQGEIFVLPGSSGNTVGPAGGTCLVSLGLDPVTGSVGYTNAPNCN